MMKICEGHLFYEEKGKAYDGDKKERARKCAETLKKATF